MTPSMDGEGEYGGQRAERAWPVSITVNRCGAFLVDCQRLIWPWQAAVRDYDPECGGSLRHHECHHRETRLLWEEERGDRWTERLNCEHTTRADR